MRKWIAIMCLIVAGIVIGNVSAEINKENSGISDIKRLFQPIDAEARKYLADERSSEELNIFTKYLVKKYNRNLNFIVDGLEDSTGKSLTQKEREKIKYLLIREHLSKIEQEKKFNEFHYTAKEEIEVIPVSYKDSMRTYKVYYTPWGNSVPYPIYFWVQVHPDVYGGKGIDDAGNSYDVNGINCLYKIIAYYNKTSVLYSLHFRDEDHPHPLIDWMYDLWRERRYGGIEDMENFTVSNGLINFNDIWDNDKTYAHRLGQHGDKTRDYKIKVKVYVSNVWNHAMDTLDKNPSMRKVWRYTR